jgi:predicted esterase
VTGVRRSPIAGHEYAFEPGTSEWTVLLLHGTGGDEHDLLGLGRQLAPDAALLSPRGRVREGGTVNRFFARRGANDIDVPDMLARTDELAQFIDGATASHELDPARIIALGYSNGANIALSMLLRRPGVLAAAALLRPVLYHEPEPLPDLAGTSVLTSSGALDPYSPPEAIERLRDVLERAGADLDLRVDPDAGHSLVAEDLLQVSSWLTPLLA